MPRSKTRNRAKPRRQVPDLSKAVTVNPTEAEAAGLNIAFEWRGVPFVVDVQAVKFGKAAFSIRVVNNESLPVMTRMDACMAVLEAAVGQEQLMKALELEPAFFDDITVLTSFWDAYTKAMHGAASGESLAS